MAKMYVANEFNVWFSEWKRAKKVTSHKEFFGNVAREQRANLDTILFNRERYGRAPTWCNVEEYISNVETLERYVSSL